MLKITAQIHDSRFVELVWAHEETDSEVRWHGLDLRQRGKRPTVFLLLTSISCIIFVSTFLPVYLRPILLSIIYPLSIWLFTNVLCISAQSTLLCSSFIPKDLLQQARKNGSERRMGRKRTLLEGDVHYGSEYRA